MVGIAIWGVAALLYAAFRFWYEATGRRLTEAEIDAALAKLAASRTAGPGDLATLRTFLEADDGREFLMLNLVKVNPDLSVHPETKELMSGAEMSRAYFNRFRRILLGRACHPYYAGRKIGPYVDSWAAPPDPGWSMVGLIRYRSRRDLLSVITHPDFTKAHALKHLGVTQTFSFPTQPIAMLGMSPRHYVGLVLAFAAALAHLAILMIR